MSYTSGNVNYAYTVPSSGSTGVATVASSPSAAGSVTILDSFTVDSILYSVTIIGGSAFQSCSSLASITIPSSVTIIGGSAFFKCSMLKSIIIPDSVTSLGPGVFQGCYALASVTIGSSVTSLGTSAFQNCGSLTSITIGNSVQIIGQQAFQNCGSLTSITIPNLVTSLGNYAFQNCGSLTSITIPNLVKSLGNYAFQNCNKLTSITIPNSVTSLSLVAFLGCAFTNFITYANVTSNIDYPGIISPIKTSLQNVTFGFAGTIPDNTCANFVNLQNVTIGPLITNLGRNTFNNCSKLTTNTIQQMYVAGFTIQQMYAAGITIQQMYVAGFTIQQMYAAGITIAQMLAAGIEFPKPAKPIISSINGTSPTILNPTVSITINPSSIDSSTTNYYYSIDGLPFVLLSPSQTISALSNALTIPISGLTSGTSHTFAIKAYNGSDSIASETSAPTIVYIPPEAPTNLVATISGNTALITFEQTEKDTITSYTYASSIDGGATYSDFSSINLTLISETQISISGLINGKTYYFKLKSSNGVNSYSIESTPSNSVFENFAQPAPKIQLVSAINTELSISFTQDKYATAYDITSYECSINGGLTYITIPNTTTPFQVPLPSSTNATYSVILKANNGILSEPSNTFTLRKINRMGNLV
jgi:hypothetical protein